MRTHLDTDGRLVGVHAHGLLLQLDQRLELHVVAVGGHRADPIVAPRGGAGERRRVGAAHGTGGAGGGGAEHGGVGEEKWSGCFVERSALVEIVLCCLLRCSGLGIGAFWGYNTRLQAGKAARSRT